MEKDNILEYDLVTQACKLLKSRQTEDTVQEKLPLGMCHTKENKLPDKQEAQSVSKKPYYQSTVNFIFLSVHFTFLSFN